MKRIFSILAVVCLIVSLAVPTLAAESYTLSGTWRFDSVLGAPPTNFYFDMPFTYASSTGEDILCTKIYITTSTAHPVATIQYYPEGSTTVARVNGAWTDDGLRTITFVGDVSVSEDFYLWFTDNAMDVSGCDGSSCPATDVNKDNICDDCGRTFALLRDYTPSDFPSGYPAVPSLDMPNARYFLYQVRSSEYTYLVVYPSTVTPTFDSTVQNGRLHFAESYGNFRLDRTNNEWVMSSDTTPYDIGGYTGNVQALYSSVQIYDEENEPFFPIPLWMEMEKVTQGEMNTAGQAVHGAMMTLAVCGIGCLALLVVLSLFGKRSLISLK